MIKQFEFFNESYHENVFRFISMNLGHLQSFLLRYMRTAASVSGILAEGIFADGIFAERIFAEWNFRRTEISPNGIFAERNLHRQNFRRKVSQS